MLYRLPSRITSKKSESNSRITLLDSVPKISAYLVILSIVFGVFKLHFFYSTLFRIPIFQYIDLSEIVLFSPSILGFLICYILTYCLVLFVPKGKIKKGWMLFYQSLIGVFLMFYIFRNSSALSEEVWGGLYLITVIPLYAIVLIPNSLLLPSSKYSLLIPFLLMIYFSVSESVVISATVHYSKYYIPVKLKLKSGSKILSGPDFKYIGRTSKYWFFYSTKNDFTRIIPEEDVSIGEISNFKTLFKSKNLNTLIPVDPRKVN